MMLFVKIFLWMLSFSVLAAAEEYTCPMHSEVRQDHKGQCPICGMDLVKTRKDETAKKDSALLNLDQTQLVLARIPKYKVTRQNLQKKVFTAGRMIAKNQVALQVYESDLQDIRRDLKVAVNSMLSPADNLNGTVTFIESFVEASSRTVRVVVTLDKELSRFISDGVVSAQIIIPKRNVIAVPRDAILPTGQKNKIFVFVSEQSLEPRDVILGMRDDHHQEILLGVKEGEEIAAGPNFLIDSESRIRGIP